VGRVLLVAVAYWAGAKLGLRLALVGEQVTPLWPPTGIALVALLAFGPRIWPGIALGAFAVNAPIGPTIPAAAGIAVGNTLAPLAAYALLRRTGFRVELDRLRDALALAGAAVGGMLVSASIGAGVLLLSDPDRSADFLSIWSVWWAGDAMGVLVIAPFLLTVRTFRDWHPSRWALAELALIVAGTAAVASAALWVKRPVLFLVFPLLLLGAWRFQQRGAAPTVLTTSVVAVLAADRSAGPFAGLDLFEKMFFLQTFNATAALTAFMLAALMLDRIHTREELAQAGADREKRAQERRRQALEINDAVVQGISAAVYALDADDARGARRALAHTLETARAMMASLLGDTARLSPGDLARAHPATVVEPASLWEPPEGEPSGGAGIRVVIADDTPDIRLLLRATLEHAPGFAVVGEAADGAEAVRITVQTRPDVVLLDLAMPVMDGLQALEQIRERVPDAKVVVLSGYGRDQVAQQAIALGAAAYVEKGGSLGKLLMVLREVGPQRATPKDREARRTEWTAASARKRADESDLIAQYVHELRNPLTAIAGLTETLLAGWDLGPETTKESLLAIQRSTSQLNALVEALSDARKVGEETLALTLSPTDLGVLVRDTVSELSALTKAHDVAVRVVEGISVAVDPPRMRQVLTNLLSNAVKFSPAGAPIEIDLRRRDTFAEVAVTDHGEGVPLEYRSKLFGKFERLGRSGKGVGLGLYVSRGIARAHGGDVVLERSDAYGCTFVVRVPTGLPPARSASAG
jgi:signal transduction histidine kinase/integral membrane sensor domain MASE1